MNVNWLLFCPSYFFLSENSVPSWICTPKGSHGYISFNIFDSYFVLYVRYNIQTREKNLNLLDEFIF
jgi:hypothetical protein